MHLCNIFSYGKKLRNWFKRYSAIIHIQSGYDHTLAAIGQTLNNIDQIIIEKLSFINTNDLCENCVLQDLFGIPDHDAVNFLLTVRNDLFFMKTIVDLGFEDHDFLFCDLRSA